MIKSSDTASVALVKAVALEHSTNLGERILQVIVSAYQLVALGAFLAALLLANSWMKAPFLGAFYEQTLMFNGAVPSGESTGWNLYSQGVRLGDRLVSVNGIEVGSAADVQNILKGFFPGETIPVVVRSGGVEKTFAVKLNAFPSEDRTTYFVLPAIISFLFLAISLWIFGLRRHERAGRSFAILSASLSLITGSFFDLNTTHNLTAFWTLGLALTGGSLIDLALLFPQEARIVVGRPYLRWLGYLLAIGLSAYAIPTLYNFAQPLNYIVAWRWIYGFVGLSSLVYLLTNVYYATRAQSPVVKSQARHDHCGNHCSLWPGYHLAFDLAAEYFRIHTLLVPAHCAFPAYAGLYYFALSPAARRRLGAPGRNLFPAVRVHRGRLCPARYGIGDDLQDSHAGQQPVLDRRPGLRAGDPARSHTTAPADFCG